MNNLQIEYLMRKHPIARNVFAGVYALDTLPLVPRKLRPAAYIVNTENSYLGGEHWIAIYMPITEPPEYFDSFGMNAHPIFERFMGNMYRKHYSYLQNPISTVCGQYCIAYIFMRYVCRKTMDDIITFFERESDADHFINSFVERVLGTDLDIYDINFLRRELNQIQIQN